MASCPSCGVAVVPGYVKCPKCGNPLPALARTKSNTFGSGGGTAVADGGGGGGSRMGLVLAIGASVAVAIILVVVLGGRGGAKTASTTPSAPAEATDTEEPATATTAAATVQPDEPTAAPAPDTQADAQVAANELDRELKRQRLWGTVNVVGQRVDVRSGACDDASMGRLIDATRARLQGAGLTKLRCLAQSGAVVFERDL